VAQREGEVAEKNTATVHETLIAAGFTYRSFLVASCNAKKVCSREKERRFQSTPKRGGERTARRAVEQRERERERETRSKMILLSSSLVSPPVLVCYLALTRSLLTLLRLDHFSDRCEICYLLDVFENQMEEKVAAMKKSRDDDSFSVYDNCEQKN